VQRSSAVSGVPLVTSVEWPDTCAIEVRGGDPWRSPVACS
jgi:hypothetical protein